MPAMPDRKIQTDPSDDPKLVAQMLEVEGVVWVHSRTQKPCVHSRALLQKPCVHSLALESKTP